MEKIVIVLVIGLQALHIAAAYRTLLFMHYVDDLTNTSYTAYNSVTQGYIYNFSFQIIVSGITILVYAALLIVKLATIAVSSKVQSVLYYLIVLLQFSYGVVVAISQSQLLNPNGPNGGTVSTIYTYTLMYSVRLADTILTWVVCVAGSYWLTLMHSDGSEQSANAKLGKSSEMVINC